MKLPDLETLRRLRKYVGEGRWYARPNGHTFMVYAAFDGGDRVTIAEGMSMSEAEAIALVPALLARVIEALEEEDAQRRLLAGNSPEDWRAIRALEQGDSTDG